MQEIKFRAVIADRNATIFFTLQDLVKPNPIFSIRELLVPWLLEGNQPDRFIGLYDRNHMGIYDGDEVEFKEIEIDNGKFSGKTRIWFRHGCFVLDKVGFHAGGLGFYTPSLYEIDEKKLEVLEVS